MTVESFEHRLVSVEHNQKMILERLTAIELAVKLKPPEPLQSNWTQDMSSDSFEQYDEFESYDQCQQYKTPNQYQLLITSPSPSTNTSVYQLPITSPSTNPGPYQLPILGHSPSTNPNPSPYQLPIQSRASLNQSHNSQLLYSQGGQQFYSPSTHSPSVVALPLPIKHNSNSLPSSEIKKEKFKSAENILIAHFKLTVPSKLGTLAVKLARKAFFGPEVMAKCTVQGVRDCPGLPSAELGELKIALFRPFLVQSCRVRASVGYLYRVLRAGMQMSVQESLSSALVTVVLLPALPVLFYTFMQLFLINIPSVVNHYCLTL